MMPGAERYLDSHLHLQNTPLGLTAIMVERARRAGVARMLCNATHEDDWQAVIQLAAHEPAIIPFLGIHPWFAEKVAAGWEARLRSLLAQVPAGVGEIGLDRCCRTDFAQQQQVFLLQLQMAAELRRPVTIHCVKAWGKLLELLEGFATPLPPVMIHSFGGSQETLQRLIRIGCCISFSGRLVDDRKLHPSFLATPLANLLLETDAPGPGAGPSKPGPDDRKMLPEEPAAIVPLYQAAAGMRGMTTLQFCQRIWNNGEIFTDSILPR